MATMASNQVQLTALSGDPAQWVYTWTCSLLPPGVPPPTFNMNASNAARVVIVTFYAAGGYDFAMTITDKLGGIGARNTTHVAVPQVLTAMTLSPMSATLHPGNSLQFVASANDQFGRPMASQPGFAWSMAGPGSLSNSGLYKANGPGTTLVKAAVGGLSAVATVVTSTSAQLDQQAEPGIVWVPAEGGTGTQVQLDAWDQIIPIR